MKTFYNPHHALHDGQQEMFRGRLVPCHEMPARVEGVLAELVRWPLGEVLAPALLDAEVDAALRRVHSERYLGFLARAWDDWVAMDPANALRDALPSIWPLGSPGGFRMDRLPANFSARLGLFASDSGTPLMAGTWKAARTGAACALAAAQDVLAGSPSAFALTRPPGHHAGPEYLGGYCFLNNGAIAAQALRDGGMDRVAILDVDYHHGNGTQTIFYERGDVLTISIHADPTVEFPFYLGHAEERGLGLGEGFNFNLPLPLGTGFAAWRAALEQAMRAVRDFGADGLVVPMGLDTFAGDPISSFALQSHDYTTVGEALASLALPTVFTLEGGYAVAELGFHAVSLLQGFVQPSRPAAPHST